MKPILFSLVFFSLLPSTVVAQITPDSSLGTENSVVESNGNRDTIQGGAVRNTNLFHSFQEFNVGAGREAYFANPNGIANIFSRVTGNNFSNIQGVLGVLGNANLYLINPNGILFGANARLDVNGSFFATTADSVVFGNGLEFSAANPNQPPLLTIDIPIGLRFRENPGDITVRGKGNGARFLDSEVIDTQEALRVDSNATIGIVGGNLIFEDATIKTAGGRIEIGSVTEGEVNLVEVANGFTLDYSGVETFGDISLSGTSVIDASGLGGGDIQVAGQNISITGVSGFLSNTLGSIAGNDITIFASESLSIRGIENDNNFVSGISTSIFPNGIAEGGDINIETGTLEIGDRALISTLVFGQGNAGNININARESISLESQGNTSAIASSVADTGVGNAGNIELNTGSLTLTNGAQLLANTLGQGNGGNVTINATDNVSLANSSRINVAAGEGGSITVNTKNFELLSGSFLLGGIEVGLGSPDAQAGDITINATDSIFFYGAGSDLPTGIVSIVGNNAVGNTSNINITTSKVIFASGSSIASFVLGQGNTGNVTINARDTISFDGSGGSQITGIQSSVQKTGIGNIGEINLNTQNLAVTNGAQISSLVSGQGNAGNVTINATETISLDGEEMIQDSILPSQIDSGVNSDGIGNSGEINLTTKNLSITNGALVNAGSGGEGETGNITITASESILLDGQGTSGSLSSVSSNVLLSGIGRGSNINIMTNNFSLSNRAQVSTGTGGAGDGGNINLTATNLSILNGASIDASSIGLGNAGDINLTTENLWLTNGSAISTRNLIQGDAGNIFIQAQDAVRLEGFGEFPFTLQDGQVVLLPFASSVTSSARLGVGGDINITAGSLTLLDGASIDAEASEAGQSGNINIDVQDTITLAGFAPGLPEPFSTVPTESSISTVVGLFRLGELIGTIQDSGEEVGELTTSQAGNISIQAKALSLTDSASIESSTLTLGNAGDILIETDEFISLRNESLIESEVSFGGVGRSGDIEIKTSELILTEGSSIAAGIQGEVLDAPAGEGEGGNIRIQATDSITISGVSPVETIPNPVNPSETIEVGLAASGLFVSAEEGTTGNAGTITVDTEKLSLTDGGAISALTRNASDAGNRIINAGTLEAINGGQIRAITSSSGAAGDIILNINDSINIAGSDPTFAQRQALILALGEALGEQRTLDLGSKSGLFANTTPESTGNGGSIFVNSRDLAITNGGRVTVDSKGQGNGGILYIQADSLTLNDQASISASTTAKEGGNIQLHIDDTIILRNNSLFSARAINNANGGNIDIDTEFIIAFPKQNNDIIASAEQGQGGNINITAEALFGIQEREATPGNETNDIDASSEFGLSGEVSIEQPTVDPTSGLVELTQEVVDASKLIAQNVCTQTANSEFVDIGKGGLPQNPDDVLAEDMSDVGLVAPVTASEAEIESNRETEAVKSRKTRKPPAQGWIWHEDGSVELVGYNPHQAGEQRTWDNQRGCQ